MLRDEKQPLCAADYQNSNSEAANNMAAAINQEEQEHLGERRPYNSGSTFRRYVIKFAFREENSRPIPISITGTKLRVNRLLPQHVIARGISPMLGLKPTAYLLRSRLITVGMGTDAGSYEGAHMLGELPPAAQGRA